MLDGPDNAVGFTQRPDFFQLFGCQLVDPDADGLGNPGVIQELVPAVLGAGESDVGNFFEADILSGFLFQFFVELDGIFVNLPHRVGHVEQRQQASGMPG